MQSRVAAVDTATRLRPRWAVGRRALGVAALLVALTVVSFLAGRARVAREEEARLEADLAAVERLATTGVSWTRVVLDRAAGALAVTEGDVAGVLDATIGTTVAGEGAIRGVAAVRWDGARAVVEGQVGSLDGGAAIAADLFTMPADGSDPATAPVSGMSGMSGLSGPPLRLFALQPDGDALLGRVGIPLERAGEPWLIVAEVALSPALPTRLPHGVDVAVTLASGPDAGRALLHTSPGRPVGEPRQSDRVVIGSDTWEFTVGGRSPLGWWSRQLPWMVLGVGLLLAVGAGYGTEVSDRRHRRAQALSAENRALDAALAELHRSEERFRGVVDAASEALFLIDRGRGTVHPLNDAAAGYLSGAAAVEALWDLVHPDEREAARERVRELTGDMHRRTLGLEARMRLRADGGEFRWTQGRFVVLSRDATDLPLELLLTLSDVTEFVEAQRRAEASAAQMAAVWNAARNGLVILDRRWRPTSANPAFLRIFGAASLAEFRRHDPNALLREPGMTIAALRERFERESRAGGLPRALQVRCRRIDGGEISVEVAGAVFTDSGRPYIVVSANDVTAQVQLNRQLQQTAEEVSAVLEAAPYPLLIVGSDGKIASTNAQATATFGLERSEFEGRQVGEILDPAFRERYSPGVQALAQIAVGSPDRSERLQRRLLDSRVKILCCRRDGSTFPAEMMVSMIPGSDAARRFVVTLIDLTEHDETEARLLQVQKHEALATVVAGVAHDFNNLLTAIGGSLQLIERELGADHRWLGNATESTARAGSLVRQLLQFSRRDAPQRRPVDLRELTGTVVELARETFDRRIDLVFPPADAADPPDGYAVEADPAQIEQVVLNLLTNARDAVLRDLDSADPAARPTPRVELSLHRDATADGGVVELVVRDNGHGIPGRDLDRIFDPFFTTKPPGKGTGMGLASAFGVITAHGGTIEVESQPAVGAAFRITLPALSAPAAPAPTVVPAGEAPTPVRGQRVLVADDEMQVLEFMIEVLADAGYAVTAVTDGEAALRSALRDSFDLVVLDINMPGRSGWEVLRELRRRPGAPPVLLVSGHADEEDARGRGAAAILAKPFSDAALLAAVAAAALRPAATTARAAATSDPAAGDGVG